MFVEEGKIDQLLSFMKLVTLPNSDTMVNKTTDRGIKAPWIRPHHAQSPVLGFTNSWAPRAVQLAASTLLFEPFRLAARFDTFIVPGRNHCRCTLLRRPGHRTRRPALRCLHRWCQFPPKSLPLLSVSTGSSSASPSPIHSRLLPPRSDALWSCMSLLSVAEQAAGYGEWSDNGTHFSRRSNRFIVRRSGILRPAVSEKNLDIMHQNVENSLASCQIETIDKDAAKHLVPNLCTPLNAAFFMPKAVNVNPQAYLQALFLACQKLVSTMSESGCAQTSLSLHKKSITSLNDLAGEYDAVIVCLGAKVDMLPELSGVLPLRMCRGIIAHLQLPHNTRG